MNTQQHECVIGELEVLIRETQTTINRAEAHGLDKTMTDDYVHLMDILNKAIKQQREHTWAMLKGGS